MAQVTLILNILKHDFVIQLGFDVSPEDAEEDKEVVVIESTGDHTVRQVGFVMNDDEEEEDGLRSRRIH